MHSLLRDDSGQDLIEYALLASLIALAVLSAVLVVGTALRTFYETNVQVPTS